MNYPKMNKAEFRVWFFDFLTDIDPEMSEEIDIGTEDHDLGGLVFEVLKRFKQDGWEVDE